MNLGYHHWKKNNKLQMLQVIKKSIIIDRVKNYLMKATIINSWNHKVLLQVR